MFINNNNDTMNAHKNSKYVYSVIYFINKIGCNRK